MPYLQTRRSKASHFFLPLLIRRQHSRKSSKPGDERFGAVIRYMEEITKNAGLNTRYVVKGDEVVSGINNSKRSIYGNRYDNSLLRGRRGTQSG